MVSTARQLARNFSTNVGHCAEYWRKFGHEYLPKFKLPMTICGARPVRFIIAISLIIGMAAMFADPHSWGLFNAVTPEHGNTFQTITHFGKSGWILAPIATVLIVALFVDWPGVHPVTRNRAHRWILAGGFIFASVAYFGLLVAIIKRLVGRARPLHFEELGIFHFRPFNDASFASFPSGHSTTVGALCTALIVLKPRFAVPIVIFGAIVSSSRVFVGAHYFSDVIAGLAFGAAGTYWMAEKYIKTGLAKPTRNWAWRWPTLKEWLWGPILPPSHPEPKKSPEIVS